LKATSPAASSESPFAKSFQTKTIAMHLAKPTSITPIAISGLSGKRISARKTLQADQRSSFELMIC